MPFSSCFSHPSESVRNLGNCRSKSNRPLARPVRNVSEELQDSMRTSGRASSSLLFEQVSLLSLLSSVESHSSNFLMMEHAKLFHEILISNQLATNDLIIYKIKLRDIVKSFQSRIDEAERTVFAANDTDLKLVLKLKSIVLADINRRNRL